MRRKTVSRERFDYFTDTDDFFFVNLQIKLSNNNNCSDNASEAKGYRRPGL